MRAVHIRLFSAKNKKQHVQLNTVGFTAVKKSEPIPSRLQHTQSAHDFTRISHIFHDCDTHCLHSVNTPTVPFSDVVTQMAL